MEQVRRGPPDNGIQAVEGTVVLEYTRAYGPEYEKFFSLMREGRIAGLKCPKCASVLLPPRPYCGFCYTPVSEWTELPDTGVVISHTTVRVPFAGQPAEPPYIYAFIMLDGADVQVSHLIREVPAADVRPGMRVKAVWAERPAGSLNDIVYFRPE